MVSGSDLPEVLMDLSARGIAGRWISSALFWLAAALPAGAAPLVNGGSVVGVISGASVDSWEFSASPGDHVIVRIADTSAGPFTPRIELFAPGGASISSASGNAVTTLEHDPTVAGTFTVEVSDLAGTETGGYELQFARFAGANEFGLLANDSVNVETITLGDLDTYTFSAASGDHVTLRIADTSASGFRPRIELYDPSGSQVGANTGTAVATVQHGASASGTFSVLVRDDSVTGGQDDETGSYELRFVRIPGAGEHGVLANDSVNVETITLGDLDTYTFSAASGDHVTLRIADTSASGFRPRIELYDPSGSQVGANTGTAVATVEHSAAATGTYTVLTRDDSVTGGQDDETGSYELRFVRVPGAGEHGVLANDSTNVESITLGDLDTYTFDATTGDRVVLRIADTGDTNLAPRIELYDPSGSDIGSGNGQLVATVETDAPATGTFTVLIRDDRVTGGQDNGVGDYALRFVRIPGANELGTLLDGVLVAETIDLGDLDTYVFDSSAGANITIDVEDVAATNLRPRVELYGPDGNLVGANSGTLIASLAAVTPLAGTYVVLVKDDRVTGGEDTGSGDYEILFTTDAPPRVVPLPGWLPFVLAAAFLAGVGRRLARPLRRP